MAPWLKLPPMHMKGWPCPAAPAASQAQLSHSCIPGAKETHWALIQRRGHSPKMFFWINTPGWLWKQRSWQEVDKKPTVRCPFTLIITSIRKMKAEVPKSLLAETSWWVDRPFSHTWHLLFCGLFHSTAKPKIVTALPPTPLIPSYAFKWLGAWCDLCWSTQRRGN